MPKKSKVNKLARMSDEERARYLQHRADVEEEARRRKRELIARFIKVQTGRIRRKVCTKYFNISHISRKEH